MINELIDKWQDVVDSSEPEDYLERELAREMMEDLTWLKKSLVKR